MQPHATSSSITFSNPPGLASKREQRLRVWFLEPCGNLFRNEKWAQRGSFRDGDSADIWGSFAQCPGSKLRAGPPKYWKNMHFGAEIHDPKARTSATPGLVKKLRSEKLWAKFSLPTYALLLREVQTHPNSRKTPLISKLVFLIVCQIFVLEILDNESHNINTVNICWKWPFWLDFQFVSMVSRCLGPRTLISHVAWDPPPSFVCLFLCTHDDWISEMIKPALQPENITYIHFVFGINFPKLYISVTQQYFSGIHFPKITFHVFVRASENYM